MNTLRTAIVYAGLMLSLVVVSPADAALTASQCKSDKKCNSKCLRTAKLEMKREQAAQLEKSEAQHEKTQKMVDKAKNVTGTDQVGYKEKELASEEKAIALQRAVIKNEGLSKQAKINPNRHPAYSQCARRQRAEKN